MLRIFKENLILRHTARQLLLQVRLTQSTETVRCKIEKTISAPITTFLIMCFNTYSILKTNLTSDTYFNIQMLRFIQSDFTLQKYRFFISAFKFGTYFRENRHFSSILYIL